MEREGERRVGGSGADRGSRGDDSIPSGSTKGCRRDLTGWAQGTEAGGNQANGMNKKGEVERKDGLHPCEEENQQYHSSQVIIPLSQPVLQSVSVLF